MATFSVEGISKKYGRNTILNNVSFEANEGDCIGCANCQDECPVGAITEIAE